MTFKDTSQPQAATRRRRPGNVVHLLQPVHRDPRGHDQARDGGVQPRLDQPGPPPDRRDGVTFDFEQLRARPCAARCRQLDRVIDINYYPIDAGRGLEPPLAPGGPGPHGPAGRVLPAAPAVRLARGARRCRSGSRRRSTSTRLSASCELAEEYGRAPALRRDPRRAGRAAVRRLGRAARATPARWDALRAAHQQHGLRNSLLIAIAPTATIASIAGCYECIEPQVSNLFKRETLSGEFLQINRYLVRDLQALGLWNEDDPQRASSWPRARCRTSTEIPAEPARRSTAPPGRSRCARSSTWRADRGAFIDQSQSLNLFMEIAEHRQAVLDVLATPGRRA